VAEIEEMATVAEQDQKTFDALVQKTEGLEPPTANYSSFSQTPCYTFWTSRTKLSFTLLVLAVMTVWVLAFYFAARNDVGSDDLTVSRLEILLMVAGTSTGALMWCGSLVYCFDHSTKLFIAVSLVMMAYAAIILSVLPDGTPLLVVGISAPFCFMIPGVMAISRTVRACGRSIRKRAVLNQGGQKVIVSAV
jgi:small-conductance mechanosensitive channel